MSDLRFLQELSERELCELVILPLLEAMGYRDIRYLHGMMEYGKDIICSQFNPIEGQEYVGFTVKSSNLDGSVSSSRSIREVYYQVKQSLSQPFLNPFNGEHVSIKSVYILTPYSISQQTIASISGELRESSRAVGFIDGPKLLDLVNEYIPNLLSSLPDPQKRYLQDLLRKLLQTRNLSSFGTLREISLNEIYTGGFLSPTTPGEAKYMSFARNDDREGGEDFHLVLSSHLFAVLLADVGAGKTTLLQKRVLDIISAPDYGMVDPNASVLPIMLELSSMPKKDSKDLASFMGWLRKSIAVKLRDESFDFDRVTASYMLLLDGFDEVQGDHEALAEYIKGLPDIFRGGVVVTSRPTRIPILGTHFSYFKVDPFRAEEIRLFLAKWFQHDLEKREQLFSHIVGDPTLFQFCKTPLLLTLYAALAGTEEVESLPTRRTDIYDSITGMLIGKWDLMRKVRNRFSPGAKSYCLESLALGVHSRRRKSFSYQEVRDVCRQVLRNSVSSPDDLVDELIFRTSLIRTNEDGLFEFAHLSFQEFFAAKQLIRLANQKKIQQILFVDWFKNVLGFYFGLTRTMDEVRISERAAAGNGHILLEFLAEADYTGNQARELILAIMAKHVLASPNLPASVLGACRRLEGALVSALVQSIDLTSPPDQIYNFFNFLIALGSSNGKIAKAQARFLHQLRPDSAALLLISLLDRFEDNDWRGVWEETLDVLRYAPNRLAKMAHSRRTELGLSILTSLREVARLLSKTSNISHQRRRLELKRVEYLMEAINLRLENG